jgi:hypothetical protein
MERNATEVLDRFGRATGPMLLAFDAEVAKRHAELGLYIRQCHAESDLALLYRNLKLRGISLASCDNPDRMDDSRDIAKQCE